MRLISVRIQNYRVHRDCKVEFDAARTLIGGPNESGKSTLVQAIRHVLFLRHSVGGAMLDSMRSTHHGGLPEVMLRFETDGCSYTLHKRFGGARGSTAQLSKDGGGLWRDDEAETQLAALMGVEEAADGRGAAGQLQGQWAHLLARQGYSPEDPLKATEGQHARLLQRLQGGQGAVVLQSPLDEHVAGEVTRLLSEHRSERGARAGGPLRAVQDQERERSDARQKAEDRLAARAQTLRDFTDAERDLGEAQKALADMAPQEGAIKTRQAEIGRLSPLKAQAEQVAGQYGEQMRQLTATQESIMWRRKRIGTLHDEVAPLTRQIEADRRALAVAETESLESRDRMGAADGVFAACRAREALASARVDELQGAQRVLEFENQQKALELHRKAVRDLDGKLAALAPVTPKHVQELDGHERARNQAQAALTAMAAGIEVLEAPGRVRVGAVEVTVGQPQVVTEDTEVLTPGGVRLRISPGGGNALADARERVRDSTHALQGLLTELGLASCAEAHKVANERRELEVRGDQLKKSRPGVAVEPEELAQQLENASQAVEKAKAEVRRRAAALHRDERLPETLESAKEWLRECKSELEGAEDARRRAQGQKDHFDKNARDLRGHLEQAEEGQRGKQTELAREEAVLAHELLTHGDDVARAQRIAQVKGQEEEAVLRLGELQAALERQRPDTLEGDVERFKRAQKVQKDRCDEADRRRLLSEGALMADGQIDLTADVNLARAAHETAKAALDRVQRRVEALDLLERAFAGHRQQVVAQYTQPLMKQIWHYARMVFGSQAQPSLKWNEDAGAFGDLSLDRGSAHPFESLSMGAREQLGVAVRLAIAKVLADAHGGCLPVVLDDAFSHSDGERVEGLLAMLDLAAQDGLQVIVLTCRPGDYAGLGACRVDLPRVASAPSSARAVSASLPPEATHGATLEPAAASVPVQAGVPGDEEALLDALRAAGGRAGNNALRNKLGWDQLRYDAAKQALLALSRVVAGRGYGGTLTVLE